MNKINYIVKDYGVCVAKQSERMVVRKEGKIIKEIPFIFLRSIIIQGRGVAITSDLLEKCCQYGIQVDFLNHLNQPYAKIYSPNLSATIEIQKAQYEALNNGRGTELTIALVLKKLENQKRLLNYFNRYYKNDVVKQKISIIEKNIEKLQAFSGKNLDKIRPEL